MRIAWMLMIGLAAGCSSVQSPTAQVRRVEVADQTPQGARIEITVALENPNDVPLPIREARYRVELADAEDFDLAIHTVATIPANGVQTLTLPAAFATGESTAVGRRIELTGSIVYEPPGHLRRLLTDSGVPLPTTSFAAAGVLADDSADAAITHDLPGDLTGEVVDMADQPPGEQP